ncbi:M24 family metallopeptidase [Bradyrhizobium elkanii]|uniref:M24 family metallopeptidase n=1 Tax=Bradyrhizobium elkanii TaxID=29448 RepID=UPI001BAA73C9|nr:Xaa-Pro peptidase family protein [Bradyrhizobium elkanii]MBR1165063.1 aminopeptidase P family protein [Bradyrhizobium elkanii]
MDLQQFHDALRNQRGLPKELAFEESEYRARIEKVRQSMGEKGLDVLLVTHIPNVCYLSGYQSFNSNRFACVVLPIHGEPKLLASELEFGCALLTSWVKDIRPVRGSNSPDLTAELMGTLSEQRSHPSTVAEVLDVLTELRMGRARIGVEIKRDGLTVEFYEGLKRALSNATVLDASQVVARQRAIKSPAELDYMRHAAQITKKGLDAVLPIIKPGITENDVAAVLSHALIKAGSEYYSLQPIVTVEGGTFHTTYKRRPLQVGQTVMMEFGGTYQRYTSGVMHTVAIGKPPVLFEKLARASNEILDRTFAAVRPGRIAHDVAREVNGGLANNLAEGYFYGGYGYSIGLHFGPSWGEEVAYIAEGINMELKPGMTFHQPVGIRIPGVACLGFSETWAVTENGCEILTEHDRTLTVAEA